MQAIVCQQYGSPEVLQAQQVKKSIPKDNEVLIKIHATTVTSADCRVRGCHVPTGFKLLRCFPFAQMIEPHHDVDAGHKRGNVVITLSERALEP